MIKRMRIIILVFTLLFAHSAHAETYDVYVTNVVDGDTIYGTYQGLPIKIRLYGIDAPENEQDYGIHAKNNLAKIAQENSTIKAIVVDFDSYGRAVSIVYTNSGLIAQEELLKNGSVWVYPQYCKLNMCYDWKNLETNAKLKNLGLWKSSNPISPWEYRRTK